MEPEFFVQMAVLGFFAGLVFALRKAIAWVILISCIFIGLLLFLEGPVRDTLNENWEGSGDAMIEWIDETVFFWVEEEATE